MSAKGTKTRQPRAADGRFLRSYPTPAKRRAVWKKLCAHLSQGFGTGSFPELSQSTIDWFMRNYPGDCCPDDYRAALREGLKKLEAIALRAAATGQGSANAAVHLMRNKAAYLGQREWRADDDLQLARKAEHDRELAALRLAGGGETDAVEVPAGRVEVVLKVVDRERTE